MAGVLIYEGALKQYFSFVIADNKEYIAMKLGILENKSNRVIWERKDVSFTQIENSKKTRADLVRRLNKGQEVDLEKELSDYFN